MREARQGNQTKCPGAVESGEKGRHLAGAAGSQHGDGSNKASHAHGACVQRIDSKAGRSALDLQAHRPDVSATGILAAPLRFC